jgi:hypothetical protein
MFIETTCYASFFDWWKDTDGAIIESENQSKMAGYKISSQEVVDQQMGGLIIFFIFSL